MSKYIKKSSVTVGVEAAGMEIAQLNSF